MHVISRYGDTTLLRLVRGEELVETLTAFCGREGISAGWIEGIGAGDRIEISYYDVEKRQYMPTVVEEEFELLNLLGNVALKEEKPFLHLHATAGKRDLGAIGGHLHSLRIAGTGEIRLTKFPGELRRSLDDETGLWLLETAKKS
ncbi:MAG: DUF296 domain-containing protein [Candidatus Terrybacteria bacterium]|nr:DUF296 domain-containing protein [Candidatus Terrybacteria bacterium]